jgi:flagellar protein FlaG
MDIRSISNRPMMKASDTEKPSPSSVAVELQPYYILCKKENFELSMSDKVLIKAIDRANKAITGSQKKFEYSVHQPTGDIVVKVLDADTNQVIRELPPEKYLDLIDKLQEICGVIIDEKR